jgi:hypothetical protein
MSALQVDSNVKYGKKTGYENYRNIFGRNQS